MQRQIGLLGLGVIGRALAQNFARHGATVHGFDPSESARNGAAAAGVSIASDPAALVAALEAPRTIFLSVPAGAAVDTAVAELRPVLGRDDIVTDLGNSHFRDTMRRGPALAADGILFLGVGVSGGEAGARSGPAIMAGGPPEAWERLRPLLEAAAASFEGQPCCALVGPDGAGHFVKMVHNGIEYAVMQIIAEVFDLLHRGLGLDHLALAERLDEWGRGELGSYLLESTAAILRIGDPGGGPFLERIDDAAGQKGTGAWAAMAALDLGVPASVLIEAVLARGVSGRKADRAAVRGVLGTSSGPALGLAQDKVRDALLVGVIVAYAQGFDLLRAAASAHGWPIDRAGVARLWRAGCIIRARLLAPIATALAAMPGDVSLLASPNIAGRLTRALPGLRASVAAAQLGGIPVPCLGASLATIDSLSGERLPTRLIQAQRDFFGRHGFARVDRPGQHHLPDGGT